MNKVRLLFFCVCAACLLFAACASSAAPAPAAESSGTSSSNDAIALAQAALDRMDGKAPSGGQSAGSQNQPAPSGGQNAAAPQQPREVTVNTSQSRPAWVDSVESSYDRGRYVAAVGVAANRAMAEKNALANLTSIFGQSIHADQTITNTYQEVIRNGVTAGWTDNTAMQNTIETSASMDTLVGAEIKEVWYDSKSTYYAAAVMEKARTAQLYTEMINANLDMITNLVSMSDAEKNSMEGYSRYQFAAAVADINIAYGNLLQVIDAPIPEGVKPGNDYRLEAVNIAKTIPVAVIVTNDRSRRIQGAFAKALADLGFRSGGNNSRYQIEVELTLSEVPLNNPNKFARYVIDANLVDTETNAVLVPYNINGREGHSTIAEAETRAVAAAERKIGSEYAPLLSDYLSRLLPEK